MIGIQEFVEKAREAGTHLIPVKGDDFMMGLMVLLGCMVVGMIGVVIWLRKK